MPVHEDELLDALMSVCAKIGTDAGEALLTPFEPRKYEAAEDGPSIAALGCVPILHMRDFQRDGAFSDAFVEDITTRGQGEVRTRTWRGKRRDGGW